MMPTPLEALIEEAREREQRVIRSYIPPEPGRQEGETFDQARDGKRLNAQMRVLIRLMQPAEGDAGRWFTPDELEDATGKRYSSLQARLRDTRKEEFHCPWYAQSKPMARGLFVWRLLRHLSPTYEAEIPVKERLKREGVE